MADEACRAVGSVVALIGDMLRRSVALIGDMLRRSGIWSMTEFTNRIGRMAIMASTTLAEM